MLGACGTQGGTGEAAGSPTPSAAASPSATFAFDGVTPVVTTALAKSSERYVNPGAVIEADGTLHMFANVFTAWPGHVSFPHLTSTDGVTWTLADPTPAFSSDDVTFAEPGADVSTGFVTDDGTWVLLFESVQLIKPWAIGRATAPGPDGPWTVEPDPILTPGPAGTFDAGGVAWPSVVRTADGWTMYYTAFDQVGGTGAITMATSTDGRTWTKLGRPVLSATEAWERGGLDRPRVAVTPRGLAMVYAGRQLTDRGLAWSTDGVTWTRDGSAPVITQARFPVEGKCWDAALTYADGTLTYYLEIGAASGTTGTSIYRATAAVPAA